MAARLLLIEPSAIDITSAYEANAVDATGSDFSSSALVSGPSPTVRVTGMNATETPSMNASKHKATGPARDAIVPHHRAVLGRLQATAERDGHEDEATLYAEALKRMT